MLRASRPRRAGMGKRVPAAAGLLTLLWVGGSLPAAGAVAGAEQGPPGPGNGGHLVVRAEGPSVEVSALTPGDRAAWLVQAHLANAPSGTLHLRLSGSGELVDHANGLEVGVRTCTEPFTALTPEARCPGQERQIVRTSRLADLASVPGGASQEADEGAGEEAGDGAVWALADLIAGDTRHLMVTLGIPGEAAQDRSLQGLTGRAGVGLYAAGGHAEAQEPPPADRGDQERPEAGTGGLAETGSGLGPWLAAGALLVVLGILAVRYARVGTAGHGRRTP